MHPDTIIASQFWKSVRSWHESAWWYGDLPEPENWNHGRRWREDDECWPWQGPRGRNGYGILNWLGKAFPAHRVAYELIYGPIPADAIICHHCDYPPCCNPRHLLHRHAHSYRLPRWLKILACISAASSSCSARRYRADIAIVA